jgi:hypothetical protein
LYGVAIGNVDLYVIDSTAATLYSSANVWKDFKQILVLTVTPEVISVSVSPATATVQQGNTQQFTATVTVQGNAEQTVTWSVTGGASGTSISASGLLTVATDETATSLTVAATSTADNTKRSTATVTVTATGTNTAVTTPQLQPLLAYPNPTTGLVHLDNPAGAKVEVYTLGGVLVGIYKGAATGLAHVRGIFCIFAAP